MKESKVWHDEVEKRQDKKDQLIDGLLVILMGSDMIDMEGFVNLACEVYGERWEHQLQDLTKKGDAQSAQDKARISEKNTSSH